MIKRIFTLMLLVYSPAILVFGQQKNIFKLNVGDCVNCSSALNTILQKDPKITFVIEEEYRADSTDVLEKFGIEKYGSQVKWNTKLYKSISKIPGSEVIFYCGEKEVSRCDLKKFQFVKIQNCNQNIYCLPPLTNNQKFYDYKNHLIIENYIAKQFYWYLKNQTEFKTLTIDSNFVKSIYLDYLKDPKQFNVYQYMLSYDKTLKPKLESVTPFNDSTVIGCIKIYKIDEINSTDTVLSMMYALIKYNRNNKNEVIYLNNSLPDNNFRCIDPIIFYNNNQLYSSVFTYKDSALAHNVPFNNLSIFTKNQKEYAFNKFVKSTVNDYLIKNQVFDNYNHFYTDNGYALMSLSNYLIDLKTEKKYYLPFPDSLFNNIKINPSDMHINFYIQDFKYNIEEKLFYLLCNDEKKVFLVSFGLDSKTFKTHQILYPLENQFSFDIKNKQLSWDGKRLIYCMKNENCYKYATVEEIQEMAKKYINK